MPWMNQEEGQLLIRFMEPLPPRNNHGNLKTSYVCFYSSEMKNLKQIMETLEVISSGGWNELDEGARRRYQNTLLNLGLITEGEGEPEITQYGNRLVTLVAENDYTADMLVDQVNRQPAFNYEKKILENLIEIIIQNPNGFRKSREYALEKVYSMQKFVNSIPSGIVNNILNDPDRLLFLQLIFSSMHEVKRYFALSQADQDNAYEIWNRVRAKSGFPSDPPEDFLLQMAYHYSRPLAKNAIQADIRFRVQAAIRAYIDLRSTLGEAMPELSANLEIRRLDNMTEENQDRYRLEAPEERASIEKPNQLIICGCPGSGKSRSLRDLISGDENARVQVITFHPDFGYSDLVGTYKPTPVYEPSGNILRGSGEPFSKGIPRITYEFIPGPLINSYLYAVKNPNINVFLVVEEINRANCNTVFGDFFQLLDRTVNGESRYSINVMPDLKDFLSHYGEGDEIKLPSNLYIWGTMNSADQGVFPLDSAFRRRWEFIYMGYKTHCLYPEDQSKLRYGDHELNWDQFRGKINEKLTSLQIHEDKLIGPYFLTIEELANSEKVASKLFLYLWEDVLRFQRKELMNFDSFADFLEAWGNGGGSPLNINFDQ